MSSKKTNKRRLKLTVKNGRVSNKKLPWSKPQHANAKKLQASVESTKE